MLVGFGYRRTPLRLLAQRIKPSPHSWVGGSTLGYMDHPYLNFGWQPEYDGLNFMAHTLNWFGPLNLLVFSVRFLFKRKFARHNSKVNHFFNLNQPWETHNLKPSRNIKLIFKSLFFFFLVFIIFWILATHCRYMYNQFFRQINEFKCCNSSLSHVIALT